MPPFKGLKDVETWAPRGLLFFNMVFWKVTYCGTKLVKELDAMVFTEYQNPQLKQFTFLFWNLKSLFVKVISFRCFLDLSFHICFHIFVVVLFVFCRFFSVVVSSSDHPQTFPPGGGTERGLRCVGLGWQWQDHLPRGQGWRRDGLVASEVSLYGKQGLFFFF